MVVRVICGEDIPGKYHGGSCCRVLTHHLEWEFG